MLNWFNIWERLAVALPLIVVTCVTVAFMCRAKEHTGAGKSPQGKKKRALKPSFFMLIAIYVVLLYIH